jgi:hypothetical protein
MAKHKPQASAEGQLNLIDDGMCRRAMLAFIVAVFDKSDRRVCRSADVVILRDWNLQGRHVRYPGLRASRGRQ